MFDIEALQFLGFPLGALIWVVVLVFFGLSTMKDEGAAEVRRRRC